MLTRLAVAALVVASWTGLARAQRPEDVAAAATAFREGQTAQLAGDYARAAELFELADATAPSPAALRSAIRNRQAAGNMARAATLAADAIARYPEDTETRTLAESVIAELRPGLGELHVRCTDACSVAIDSRSVHETPGTSFDVFVDPGSHSLVASWAGREPVSRTFELAAGASSSFELATPTLVAVAEPEPEPDPAPAPSSSGDGGVTPVVFGVGAGLTVVSGGILLWSGLDVLSARDAYVAAPTEAGYRDGLDRETRTNVLVGVTGALALGTVIVAIFTDWDGDSSVSPLRREASPSTAASITPTFAFGPDEAHVGVGGRF